jgi:hypothetical protein
MTASRVATLPRHLIDTLPPGRYSLDCADGDFGCEHWAHGTKSPEGNVILSGEFAAFLDSKASHG